MHGMQQTYRDSGFEGVMIPDHTPATNCEAPWHAGIAFAIGYMKASATAAGIPFEEQSEEYTYGLGSKAHDEGMVKITPKL